MNRTRWPIVALVVGWVFAACVHASVVPGPRLTADDSLPADPGPGFLYIRAVSGSDTVSYAVIVFVGKAKGPEVKAVVGPIDDWPAFFGKVRAAYWAHGPGEAYCARPGDAGPCSNLRRAAPGPYTQAIPPRPPPPADGYAVVYSAQSGKVNPDELSDAAATAAAAAAAALGQ